MSFFAWNMEMSFFWYAPGPDLAYNAFILRYGYHRRYKLGMWICTVAPPDPVPVSGRGGQALYILDVCPENRDESNGDSIIKL
jgi:hypothetical protein